jgi:hypothetical protein
MKGSGIDLSGGVYLVGTITGWDFIQMTPLGDSLYSVIIEDATVGNPEAYYFITTDSWDNYEDYRESVPEACAYSDEVTGEPGWTVDRGFFVPSSDTVIGYVWGTCKELDPSLGVKLTLVNPADKVLIYPNPASGTVSLIWNKSLKVNEIYLYDLAGKEVFADRIDAEQTLKRLDVSGLADGLYIMRFQGNTGAFSRKLVIRNH